MRKRTHGRSLAEKIVFFSGEVSPSGCILWTGTLNKDGYACLFWQRKVRRVSRLVWVQENGEIPNGLNVLHRCDVRNCVNPGHLFLGTQLDNVRDMFAKGRAKRPTGTNHFGAKLTEDDVKTIRQSNLSDQALSMQFAMSKCQINKIRNYRAWRQCQ